MRRARSASRLSEPDGHVLGYLYSTSSAAPHRFGDERQVFERDLAAALGALGSENVFVERAEFSVIVGRKPSSG